MKVIPVTIKEGNHEATVSLVRKTIRFKNRRIVTYLLSDENMQEIEARIQPIIEEIANRRLREIDDQFMRDVHQ